MGRDNARTVDEYIASFEPEVRERLEQVRAIIGERLPEATETISYGIPTFDLNGRHVVHFAGYAHHVGLYPTPSGMEAFEEELRAFKTGKGSVRFPLSDSLPADLIARIVDFRKAEVG